MTTTERKRNVSYDLRRAIKCARNGNLRGAAVWASDAQRWGANEDRIWKVKRWIDRANQSADPADLRAYPLAYASGDC
jgi:hypothetical protein